MHFLISQSTHRAVLGHQLSSARLLLLFPLSIPAAPELIVFALLINLSPPQGMSHIGLWMNTGCAGTKTCTAFSNEFQLLRAPGEFACCDWHLLRRTGWLRNRMKADFSRGDAGFILQQSTMREPGLIWLSEIMGKFGVTDVSLFKAA